MNFASDNIVGASGPVLEALVRANDGALPAYGGDEITARVERTFAQVFERDCAVFLVATGTAANALALASAVPPWGRALCHREAHVAEDECGAPEFYTHGGKLVGLPGAGAKISAASVSEYVANLPKNVKQMPAKALSISQATECGLVYDIEEIAALGEVCRAQELAFHLDGARFANAMASLGCTPAEMTWKQGVDIVSFGGTKNGCLMAEAIVVFDGRLAESLAYRRKRAGQLISKGRLIAAQFDGYFADGHWIANARHANHMAKLLADGLADVEGVRLAWLAQANEVFPILPRSVDRALQAAGILYHPWSALSLPEGQRVGPDEVLVRLVTSFATREEEVQDVLRTARSAALRHAAE